MRALCLVFIFIAILIATQVPAQEFSDPNEILNQYFQASGGLDQMKAERTSYSEGTISVGGMEGTLKTWIQKPGLSRAEIALGPLEIIQGDNGDHAWMLDQNGKLQVITNPDEATVKRRQVRKLMEEYTFIKQESDVFIVGLEGIEQVDGKDCFVIEIANNINVDSYKYYINTRTFIREKAVFIEDIESRDIFFGDYREIEGLIVPFWTKEVSHQTGQVQETKLDQYASNLDIDPVLFEPPEQSSKDYQFIDADRAENIPFEFIENHLFIPVTVAGKERLWVLDTGAGMTVLNKAFAEELGLEMEGEIKGQGAGGVVDVNLTTMPSYSVKGIRFQDQIAAVIDMDELIRRLGLDVVGILGFDFLSRFVTKVDYANELVSFYEPETFTYTGEGHIADIHLANNVFRTSATLDDEHPGNWMLDLGAGTTLLDGRYALREGYTEKHGVVIMGHGAGNEYQLKKVRCDSMQFAGFTIHDPEISFAYGGSDTAFAADRIGILGNSLFRNFVLYCDYAGERLIVEKGGRFDQPWPVDNSGLQIAWNLNHEIEVLHVSQGTPAERGGFMKGDILRSINEIDAVLFEGVIAIRKLLRSDPGTKYEIVVNREGKSKKLQIKLADLL